METVNWSIIYNSGLVLVTGWALKQVYTGIKTSIDKLSADADIRATRIHERLDGIQTCLTTVKVDVESKQDKDRCEDYRRDCRHERVTQGQVGVHQTLLSTRNMGPSSGI